MQILKSRGVVVSLFLVFGLLFGQTTEALATSVKPLNLEDLMSGAELIFIGKLISANSFIDLNGLPVTAYEFEVLHPIKGSADSTITIRQFGLRESDFATGRAPAYPGVPTYEIDGVYLLFVNGESRFGLRNAVGLGQGAFSVFQQITDKGDLAIRVVNAYNNAGLFKNTRILNRLNLNPNERTLLQSRGDLLPIDSLVSLVEKFVEKMTPSQFVASRGPSAVPLSARLVDTLGKAPAEETPSEDLEKPLQGPLVVASDGSPYVWNIPSATNPSGALTAIPYNPDGDLTDPVLGTLSKADADAAVANLFNGWTADSGVGGQVPTTSVKFVNAGNLPVDCTASNITATGCLPNFADGFNPIIYDEDGNITRALFGNGAECSILGFAGPDFGDSSHHITEASATLNGIWIDGKSNSAQCGGNTEISQSEFLGVFAHEFGHFFGLDHTQINLNLYLNNASLVIGSTNYGVPPLQSVATMEPFASGQDSKTLETDDKASVSRLYPALDGSFSNLGSIGGKILRSDGATPFDCANVIARDLSDPFHKAVSGPSGDRGSTKGGASSLRGVYEIVGLPSGSYAVKVERIRSNFIRGSSVGPCDSSQPSLPGPEEFWNSAESSSDTPSDFTALTINAGTVLTSKDIILNAAPAADLSVSQTVAPTQGTVGNNLTYSVTVTNNGPATASSVALTVSFSGPAIAVFSVVPSQGSCNNFSSVSCSLLNLSSGASALITIVVTPNSGGTLTSTAAVSSAQSDSNSTNNSYILNTNVSGGVDLSITQLALPDPVTAGNKLTYTINIVNAGSATATNVTLTDTLPSGATFASATPQNSCALFNSIVTCQLSNLASAANTTVAITVIPAAPGIINNTAVVSANEADSNPADNTKIATTNVTPACPGVTLVALPATLEFTRKNQRKTITLTITNNSTGVIQVLGFTPLFGQPFTITSISPRLSKPKAINPGKSKDFSVHTRGPALAPATATGPFFSTALSCGTVTSTSKLPSFSLEDLSIRVEGASIEIAAKGQGIDSMTARVYDLKGRLVLVDQSESARLTIEIADTGRKLLANGLYLALITVRNSDNTIKHSEIKKILIHR